MIKRYPIKYKDGKMSRGIVIDWAAVKKEYRRLKIPKQYYYPLKADFSRVGYVISMSDRSRGKTTQILILGLVLYAMYGEQLQYIRQLKSQCEPKMIRNLYAVVLECGYISKIFGDQWNSIFYRGKRWYLCRVNENGEIEEKDSTHCTACFGVDECFDIKSTYNAPLGDIVLYDEFISDRMGYNEFRDFCDMCKTIFRDRYGTVCFLAANTINKNSRWFDEYAIADTVRKMEQGDTQEVASPLGSHFFIEIMTANASEDRAYTNRRMFGFHNPKLAAITGRGTWAEESFPHIPPDPDDEREQVHMMCNRIFIEMNGQLMKLAVVRNPEIGICVYVTPATKLYDDSVIFTADEVKDRRYVFLFGKGLPVNFVWDLYTKGRWYYAHNAAGCWIRAYVTYAQGKLRNMTR